MQHLSGLDATFLHLETPEMPMHVGALHLLDLPAGDDGQPPDGADFVDRIKRHIADRLHLAPVFTRKLAFMPLDITNPVWVDDDDLDLDYHIRHLSLARPGTRQQLEAAVARLHSGLLDRSRPLWEFYLITGLQSGQAGFYTRFHHAALDGQGAMVLAAALLDVTPEPRKVAPPEPHDKSPYQPPLGSMLKAALADTLSQCARLVMGVPTGVKAAAAMLAPGEGARRPGLPSLAPRTPLNRSITNQRIFAAVTLDLKQALALGKSVGATLNDVVLATVSGALRRYLEEHDALPEEPLVAAVPVSLRPDGDTGMGNHASMLLMKIASDESDPVERLRSVMQASVALKTTVSKVKSILPTEFPSLGVPWMMSGLVSVYGRTRLADKLPPVANVVVSNVPGPRMPLYLAGARITATFPVSIVTHGLGLNVTVQSYDGALDVGIVACRRVMPDMALFAACISAAFDELAAAVVPTPKKRVRAAKAAEAKPGGKPATKPRTRTPKAA